MANLIRYSVINKVFIFCLFIVAVSCEDLTDNLSPRDNILDTWKCEETGPGGNKTFLVEITENGLNGIKIYNINLLGANLAADATVSGSSISIPSQDIDGFVIKGSGTIKSGYDEIALHYTVDDGGGVETYNAVLTKP